MKKFIFYIFLSLFSVAFASTSLTGCAGKNKDNSESQSKEDEKVQRIEESQNVSEAELQKIDDHGTPFEFSSDNAISEYTGISENEVNSRSGVTNAKILLKLQSIEGRSGGKVYIRYKNNDRFHVGIFESYHNDVSENSWHEDSATGLQRWKGFFQDTYGAIVVIINQIETSDNEGGEPLFYGSVWFKNFEQRIGQNTQAPSACWKIRVGPYKCRTSMRTTEDSDGHRTWHPAGYEKLGEFYNLDLDETGLLLPE